MKQLGSPHEVLEYISENEHGITLPQIVPIEYGGNFDEFMTPKNLQTLSHIFDQNHERLFGVSLLRKGGLRPSDQEALGKKASYRLSQEARTKNLGFHRDAIHAPGTKSLRITGLYSPFGSYSNTPTVFTQTKKIDTFLARDSEFQEFVSGIPELSKKVHMQVLSMLHDPKNDMALCYWTSMYNMILADGSLNSVGGNKALSLRDSITSRMMGALGEERADFHTRSDESSLLFFPNGFGPNLSIAHSRHNTGKKEGIGELLNYAIGETGNIQKPK